MANHSILWRRLDRPGHEVGRLVWQQGSWQLIGTAVYAHDQHPCRLEYAVLCDAAWQTVSGMITGWVGHDSVEIELAVDAGRRWRLNGAECPAVAGCLDLDLNFSPATNLLPIRRLNLDIGEEGEVQAAWLRFPSFTLEPLMQRYRRLAVATYRYESAGGTFVTELQVNPAGFVLHYPNFAHVEASL